MTPMDCAGLSLSDILDRAMLYHQGICRQGDGLRAFLPLLRACRVLGRETCEGGGSGGKRIKPHDGLDCVVLPAPVPERLVQCRWCGRMMSPGHCYICRYTTTT